MVKFAIPVFFALVLQALYGMVDLLIVGRFATSNDMSAVGTGTQIMMSITFVVCALSMGTTISLGQSIGAGDFRRSGKIIGSSISLFGILSLLNTVIVPLLAPALSRLMNAPSEAFDLTVDYVVIIGLGSCAMIFYNLIGGVFRGMGDSKTPLITVAVACVVNIVGDLWLVAGLGMGTCGAALATVFAQLISVIFSLWYLKRQELPFALSRSDLRLDREVTRRIVVLGAPLSLQSLLVSTSFLVILAIVNNLGVAASAGVGVSGKICDVVMLFPSAFSQAVAAFVSHNIGAKRYDRACLALKKAIAMAMALSLVMFWAGFWHGDDLARIFTNDAAVIASAYSYLRAYAIDSLLTSFLFCYIGFYNGLGMTKFVLIQGLVGAFVVRIPVAYFMSKWEPVSLFHIGLATPMASVVQIALCFGCMLLANKQFGNQGGKPRNGQGGEPRSNQGSNRLSLASENAG